VQYGLYAFTRSPRYFNEPHNYHPERWLPENHIYWKADFKSDAREGFFPFSQGPRGCPGMTLAWHETRLFVAKLLWSFDVEMLPNQKIVFERDFKMYAMWEKPEFRVHFHPVVRES
jgi:cytochrome P450